MMLIDEIMACEPEDGYERHALPDAVIFRIDAVNEYLNAEPFAHREQPPLLHDALPNVAPLAPVMWFEWNAGAYVMGTLVMVGMECKNDDDLTEVRQSSKNMMEAFPRFPHALLWHHAPDGARWGYVLRLYLKTLDGSFTNLRPSAQVYVDSNGHAMRLDEVFGDNPEEPHPDTLSHELKMFIFGIWHRPLFAICFAHCKGVTTTEHQQPRQQRRAAERAGRPPLVTYKTIDIEPVTRILRDEGDVEHNGIKKALHICRGHFAHYTKDAPLFGKYTGTYYKPMHVRGSLKSGVVVKDYKVTDNAAKVGASRKM